MEEGSLPERLEEHVAGSLPLKIQGPRYSSLRHVGQAAGQEPLKQPPTGPPISHWRLFLLPADTDLSGTGELGTSWMQVVAAKAWEELGPTGWNLKMPEGYLST